MSTSIYKLEDCDSSNIWSFLGHKPTMACQLAEAKGTAGSPGAQVYRLFADAAPDAPLASLLHDCDTCRLTKIARTRNPIERARLIVDYAAATGEAVDAIVRKIDGLSSAQTAQRASVQDASDRVYFRKLETTLRDICRPRPARAPKLPGAAKLKVRRIMDELNRRITAEVIGPAPEQA